MEDYRLAVPFSELKSTIEQIMQKGNELMETPVKTDAEFQELKIKKRDWKAESADIVKRCFKGENSFINEIKYGTSNGYQIGTPDLKRRINKVKEDIKSDIGTLEVFLKYAKHSEIIIYNNDALIEQRKNLSIEEKQIIVLKKLKEVNDGRMHDLGYILMMNGVEFSHSEELLEICQELELLEMIDIQLHPTTVIAKIKARGSSYLQEWEKEQSKQSKGQQTEDKSDYEEVCRKLDEILARLEKMELKTDVEHQIIFEEVEELKGLYLTLSKKNWRQIVLGKIVDLGAGKLVEKETLNALYGLIKDAFKQLPNSL